MSCIEHFPLTLWLALFCENAEGLKRMTIVVKYLGLSDYQETYDAMREFTKNRNAKTPDEIWLLEHTPVFTLGLAGDPSNLHSPSNQIPLMQADRGGEITYHGPGQIVAYLLLDLRRLGIHVKELVNRIEQAVIDTLSEYNLQAQRKSGAPGIYVAVQKQVPEEFHGAKIAALGLKVSKGCSYHGLALNYSTDLDAFSRIHPCGYEGLRTIDMETLGIGDNIGMVSKRLTTHLQQQLLLT